MQNSEYLALPIVCQRICSDVLWHFTTVQAEPETARSRLCLWSSRHICFHVHVTTSTWRVLLFSFLGLFGLLYPLSACIPAETQSHVQASTWESGLVRPKQAPWSQLTLVPAVSVKRTTLPTQCVLSGSLRFPAPLMLNSPQGFCLSELVLRSLCPSLSYLSNPLYAPHSSGVTANPRTCWEGALFCLV